MGINSHNSNQNDQNEFNESQNSKEKESGLSKLLMNKNEKISKYFWIILDIDSYFPEVREGVVM